MKLPFDLGVKLVFRLLLPGFFLMLGVRPLLLSALESSGAGTAYHDLALTVATLILGWLLTILDMPIYMLFEGRRFWPARLLLYGLRREEFRLERWIRTERWNYDRSHDSRTAQDRVAVSAELSREMPPMRHGDHARSRSAASLQVESGAAD